MAEAHDVPSDVSEKEMRAGGAIDMHDVMRFHEHNMFVLFSVRHAADGRNLGPTNIMPRIQLNLCALQHDGDTDEHVPGIRRSTQCRVRISGVINVETVRTRCDPKRPRTDNVDRSVERPLPH